jgi:hypothetical protein
MSACAVNRTKVLCDESYPSIIPSFADIPSFPFPPSLPPSPLLSSFPSFLRGYPQTVSQRGQREERVPRGEDHGCEVMQCSALFERITDVVTETSAGA